VDLYLDTVEVWGSQKAPGLRHRDVGNGWYQDYGKRWSFSDPFPEWRKEEISKTRESRGPDVAEERMASDAHDHLDRTWDELPQTHRKYWEGFFVWLLYHPDILESWAHVDVVRGRVLRIINGVQAWEESPETAREYRELRRRASRNHKHGLRDVLTRYG
jgi:hypothetical protein